MSKIKMRNFPNVDKKGVGYMGKIQYWTGKLNEEVMQKKVPNLYMIYKIHDKLDYFIQRQAKLEGRA